MQADDLIQLLNLAPLPGEGGYFRRTHEGATGPDGRAGYSVIYYLLTPDQPRSQLHWLPIAETYHFYLGDPVKMLILEEGASGCSLVLGQNIGAGQHVQMKVPANCWHGSHLIDGGQFALLGTTMTPGYMDQDYRPADLAELQRQFPEHTQLIQSLTGETS